MNADAMDIIRETVSAYEAGRALGLNPDRHGRCACPVHSGKDRNCNLDKGVKGFYCHVCHRGGDVISLVQYARECTFPEAVAWLNEAFRLGIDLDKHRDRNAKKRALRAKEWRLYCHEQDKAVDKAVYDSYMAVGDWVNGLERDAVLYRPRAGDDEWDERFVTALRQLPGARDNAEWLSAIVIGVKI